MLEPATLWGANQALDKLADDNSQNHDCSKSWNRQSYAHWAGETNKEL